MLLNFNEDKISVLSDSDHQDVEISGTLSSFIFYASTGGSDLSSKITITGDIESANALNSFFKESNLLRIIIIELIGQKPTSTLFLSLIHSKINSKNPMKVIMNHCQTF